MRLLTAPECPLHCVLHDKATFRPQRASCQQPGPDYRTRTACVNKEHSLGPGPGQPTDLKTISPPFGVISSAGLCPSCKPSVARALLSMSTNHRIPQATDPGTISVDAKRVSTCWIRKLPAAFTPMLQAWLCGGDISVSFTVKENRVDTSLAHRPSQTGAQPRRSCHAVKNM